MCSDMLITLGIGLVQELQNGFDVKLLFPINDPSREAIV